MHRFIPFLINEHMKLKKRLAQRDTWLKMSRSFLFLALTITILDLSVPLSFIAGSLSAFALMYAGILHIGERERKRHSEKNQAA